MSTLVHLLEIGAYGSLAYLVLRFTWKKLAALHGLRLSFKRSATSIRLEINWS
jgi:hypothetical protein